MDKPGQGNDVTAGDLLPDEDDDAPLSPLDEALQRAEAELDGDDDEDDEPADEPGETPDDDEPAEDEEEDDDSDDDAESDDADDDEESDDDADEEEPGDDEVVIELPESLKAQGYDDVVVGKGQEELFRAVFGSYETRQERETRESELRDASDELAEYEAGLMEEIDDFRLLTMVDPFKVVETSFQSAEEAEDALQLYLLSDEKRFARFAAFVGQMQDGDDDGAAARTLRARELGVDQKDRADNAKRRLRAVRAGREAAKAAQKRVGEVLEKIKPDEREFVQARLVEDIRAAARKQKERTGSDVIDADTVDRVAEPWLERFGIDPSENGDGANGKKPKKKKGADAKAAEDAVREDMKKKARARKRAKKVGRSRSDASGGPPKPEKGAQLDDVLKGLKTGKVKI